MIVRGSKSRENQANKDSKVEPPLTGIDELASARLSIKKCQSPQSNDEIHNIGGNITEVRDSQPDALISEVMVVGRKIRPGHKQRGDSEGNGEREKGPNAGALRKHEASRAQWAVGSAAGCMPCWGTSWMPRAGGSMR